MLNFVAKNKHRKHPRQRVLKEGKIISSITHGIVDVTVRDLSVGGARIQIPKNTDFHEPFSLMVMSKAILSPATAKWRKGEIVGIAFEDEPQHVRVLKFKN